MNNVLSTVEEQRLVQALEKVIHITNDGTHPNVALAKVAQDFQFTPEFISRMVEAFNKSKTCWMLKHAHGDERAKPFPIADVTTVLRTIYGEQKEAKAIPVVVPSQSFVLTAPPVELMQKAATAPVMDIPVTSVLRHLEQYAGICSKVLEQTRMRVQEHKYAFDQAVAKASGIIMSMSYPQLQKTAQMVVNGYPKTGVKLLRLLSFKSRQNIPEVQKTANAAIFPVQEPYLSIAAIYANAEKLAWAEHSLACIQKEAQKGIDLVEQFKQGMLQKGAEAGSGFVQNFLANAGANVVSGIGLDLHRLPEALAKGKDPGDVKEDLDVPFFNKIKGLEAKRIFMELVLYDKDLQQYDFSSLVNAYNTSVSAVPQAYRNPSILKSLMIKNLQSSGVKDVFEMGQEAELSKTLGESEIAKKKLMLEEAKLEELKKPKGGSSKGTQVEFPKTPSMLGSVIEGVTGTVSSIKGGGKKDESKPKPKPEPGPRPRPRPRPGP